jgi:hypothetical protein
MLLFATVVVSIGSFPFTAKMFVFDVEIVKLDFDATSGNWCMEFWRESSEAVEFYFADIFDCSQYFGLVVCHTAGYIMAPNWLVILQFITVVVKKGDLRFSGENKKFIDFFLGGGGVQPLVVYRLLGSW